MSRWRPDRSVTLDSVLMQLPELIDGLPIAPGPESAVLESTEVEGIAHDSRRVKPGDLFVTWKGLSHDGACFVPEAMERGAVAVLTAEPLALSPEVPALIADRPRDVLGDLAARVYRHPDRRLRLVGITGTNGKTTVASLITAMLEADDRPSGCLGTLGYRFGERRIEGARTTPEASDLLRLLQESYQEGARDLVMEVSSHALAQGRVAAVRFDVAVFLNLSRDHLDFHDDMEAYFEHKSRLFELLKDDGRCVVNVDDDWGRRLAERLPGALTFGEGGAVHFAALDVGAHGISGRIITPRFEARFESPLLGPYNAENLLAATAAAEALELSRSAVETALCRHPAVEGRMESVRAGQPYPVIVDYAHTDAALRAALRAMRSLGDYRVLVVFGCGGGRDRGKRALMGRAAGELADYSILTSDNPRDEDPHAILKAVEEGLISAGEVAYEVIEDRRQAIRRAIELASPAVGLASADWAVLIAGKGHEKVQIVGSEKRPFVDAVEAAKAIEEHFGTASDC